MTGAKVVELPAAAGYVTFRPASKSGDPAIDIKISGLNFKIHFPDEK